MAINTEIQQQFGRTWLLIQRYINSLEGLLIQRYINSLEEHGYWRYINGLDRNVVVFSLNQPTPPPLSLSLSVKISGI